MKTLLSQGPTGADIKLESFYLYGSSRLGELSDTMNMRTDTTPTSIFTRIRGRRHYELSNHLGNVMVVVSDRKIIQTDSTYIADLVSATDYYAFGMVMPDRNINTEGYRFGFNGKENDNEIKGTGNSVDFGSRIYDTRLGRFLSTDKKESEYPWQSPYAYALNNPIYQIDVDGKGPGDPPANKTVVTTVIASTTAAEVEAIVITNADINIKRGFIETAFQGGANLLKAGAGAVLMTVALVFSPPFDQMHQRKEYMPTSFLTEVERISTHTGDLTSAEAIAIKDRIMGGKGTANDFLRLKEANTKTGLTGPARKSDRVAGLPPQLQRRVKLWQQTKDDIIRSATLVKDENGEFRFFDDVTKKPIEGDKITIHPDDPNLIIRGNYDFGHTAGDRAWQDYQNNGDNWNKTRDEIIKDQNKSSEYRVQTPGPNRSDGAKKPAGN